MKKIFSILAIATLLSCSTDDDNSAGPEIMEEEKMPCNCFIVLEVEQLTTPSFFYPNGTYRIKRKNDCGVTEEINFNARYEVGWWMCN